MFIKFSISFIIVIISRDIIKELKDMYFANYMKMVCKDNECLCFKVSMSEDENVAELMKIYQNMKSK